MADELELTILMPCLNEAETLAVCIAKAQSFLSRTGISGEILIADNGSTDSSQDIATKAGARVVPICAALEAQITELEPSERPEFLASVGLEEPGLNSVIRAGYELLGLSTYFTAGKVEVRAWTIRVGAKAPEFSAPAYLAGEPFTYNLADALKKGPVILH